MAYVDNYNGIEVCANDVELADMMNKLNDLKSSIDNISEELYKIVSEISIMSDWEGNGKDVTIRVLKALLNYASMLSGKSGSTIIDNFVKTSGLTINGESSSDHLEQLTNAISEFASDIVGFEGTSTPVMELLSL